MLYLDPYPDRRRRRDDHGARRLLEAHGYNPFFIGDEIYWRVTSTEPPATGSWFTSTPQTSRLDLFDAVTAYSLFIGDPNEPFSPWQDFVGYPGDTHIVADERGALRGVRLGVGWEGAGDPRRPARCQYPRGPSGCE